MFFIALAEIVLYAGVGMVTIGMFVTNLMFHRMSLEVEPPKSIRETFSILWVTSARSKSILHKHSLIHPKSKARILYKIAGIGAITGLIGVVASILTTCVLIMH
jgi:hypothetical protein